MSNRSESTIKGLRTQEGERFHRFFALIQAEAQKQSATFFADAGDGNEFETSSMEGENMMGWLIPKNKVNEFEPEWRNSDVDDKWTDYFKWAIWYEENGCVAIRFED